MYVATKLALVLCVFAIFASGFCDEAGGKSSRHAEENSKDPAIKGATGSDGKSTIASDEDVANSAKNNTKSAIVTGAQRRPMGNSLPKRDSQLLSLLAARRRQLLADRVGTHLATIATFANKPDKHNITNAHLEIRDSNNTVIKRIIVPDNNKSSSAENRPSDVRGHASRPLLRPESTIAKLTPEARSQETKSTLNAKALQEAKVIRAGVLNQRRKPASEVVRFGPGTRKPLIDLSVVSHETLGIPENRTPNPDSASDEKDDVDVILDPDEEFQVDESNHGIYLYNYTTNATSPYNSNDTVSTPISSVNSLNITLTTNPSLVESTMSNETLAESIANVTNTEGVALSNKTEPTTTTKPSKIEPKENENNTLFLTDELYNHFRPLESELPVEDMAPFIYFGQKITLSAPKDNVTQLQFSPTKPTHYIRTVDKKRGTYRPVVTEKNVSEENEEEVNENMDVSVVKNVIEKNKIRNTIKMQAPSRHTNLVSAYRKQQIQNSTATISSTTPMTTSTSTVASTTSAVSTTMTSTSTTTTTTSTTTTTTTTSTTTPAPIITTVQSDVQTSTESPKIQLKDDINTTSPFNLRSGNRTYYNFRRKPIKVAQLNNATTEKEILPILTTTTPPSTVVYTAVVTSVSITSSVKAQNKTENRNETELVDPKLVINATRVQNDNATSIEDLTTVESVNAASSRFNITTNELNNDSRRKNETLLNKYKKKSDLRQRISTSRPRVRFTTHSRLTSDVSNQPSPTPFIIYSNKTSLKEFDRSTRLPHLPPRYRSSTSTTEKTTSTTTEAIETSDKVPVIVSTSNSSKPCNDSFGCGSESVKVFKEENPATKTFKVNDFSETIASIFNKSDSNNSYLYISDTFTASVNTTVKPEIPSTEITNIINNTLNLNTTLFEDKDLKEVLERRNNEVLIEMEKSNMTTYILAGLGFLPLTLIVMFVLRHIFLKKTKDIDTDYEGYFQDSDIKKESQITTVARPPIPPPLKKPDEKWEFPRSKLRLQTLIGQGNFGQVWKAEADDLTGHDGLTRLVAVKTIKETASQKEKQELLHEICIMQKIGNHPNVVTLLACCTEQEPYLLIMEYVMCGKLLTYLRDRRSRVDRFQMPRGGLTSRDLTVFAYCVARGMDYLASKGIVHRDLAARNVLVDHNKLCKIADFGMSKEISSSDDKGGKPQRNALPVRWMAPEALLYSVYSHETDVWAYGVLLWEIVTLGSTPYATMSGREVLHMVTEGYRLERPAHCKPHLYQTMHACWHSDPSQRPPFSEIKTQLSELLENEPTEGNYVDLESFYQDSSVYSDPSAIIENDGGISIEYSDELSSKLRKDEIPRRSFHIPNATSLQRNYSNGNSGSRNSKFRGEAFNTVRAGNHTTVGGFGIMDGGFSGRDGNFCERNPMEKLSGASFHRERDNSISRENGHPGNSLISRNSFNGISNQNTWSVPGGKPFFTKSGSSRSKRISEFECNI
ncbi:uncharacterized protein LOC143914588 [Arctopsyche grandis]|uniref:uncharacterized protein LOC143914588 n=1 Tax=Arctopsyche grandis TaxID=121162 RepID=UPI00406D67A8